MKRFSCIVVDDESFAVRLLEIYIKKIPELNLLKTFNNPELAKEYLTQNNGIDILFTDVNMPQVSGITMAESIFDIVGHIVFVTSNLKSQVQPRFDKLWYFLPKPTGFEDFRQVFSEIQSTAG